MPTPRITLLRLVVSAGTAAVGLVSYKIQEGKEWLEDRYNAMASVFQSIPTKKSVGYDVTHAVPDEHAHAIAGSNVSSVDAPEEFGGFVRRMLEIDSLLRSTKTFTSNGEQDEIKLPKIVVVGSQSSGKSSVLEALVGHAFLPKGNNMVTRRPLLLTLINDPSAIKDFAVFPSGAGVIKIDDFDRVSAYLKELNMAVPEGEWVSEDPIEMHVHSKYLPDLTLIDLPGYIAVSNRKQPSVLRERIQSLCDKFIAEPNIILAVSAADVDLANSEALLAAKRVDPTGSRTIGVITKLDLVDPNYGANLLANDDYPLANGYVGVICGAGKASADAYAAAEFGVNALRSKLTNTLDKSLRGSLSRVLSRVQDELAEIRYELKARFADKSISAEGYMAEIVGKVREALSQVTRSFSKAHVKLLLQKALFDKMLIEMLLDVEDNDNDDLNFLVMQMTRAGWGRKAANRVSDEIMQTVKTCIFENGPMEHHPVTSAALLSTLDHQCRSRVIAAAEQIENALKPFKHADPIEFDASEWKNARRGLLSVFEQEEREISEQSLKLTESLGGQNRVRRLVGILKNSADSLEQPDYKGADEIVKLWQKCQRIKKLRLSVTENRHCRETEAERLKSFWPTWLGQADSAMHTPSNAVVIQRDPCMAECPAVYLYLLSRRLLALTALYAQDELAPDTRIADMLIDRQRANPDAFIAENEHIRHHLSLLSRQSALESVRERLVFMQHD